MLGDRRTAWWVLLAALATACAGPRAVGPAHLPVPADEGKRVHAILFEGVTAFPPDMIVDKLALRGPSGTLMKTYVAFERLSERLDRRRIEAFYAAHGYFSAKVTKWTVVPLADDSVDVLFTVEEGRPTRITEVNLVGDAPGLSEAQVRRAFGLSPGAIFAHDEYLLGRDLIRAELVRIGYINARVTGEVAVDRDAHTAVITLTFEAGTQFHFGTFKVAGTSSVPASTVRARASFREGEVFDPAALVALQGRLLRMGLFGQVRVAYEPDPAHPDRLDVTATVSDGMRHDLRLGAGARVSGIAQSSGGLGMRLDPHLRASYTLNRVFDPLSTLALDFRPGYAFFVNEDGSNGFTGSLSATLGRQDLLAPHLHGAVTLAYDADVLEAYQAIGPRVRLGLDHSVLDEKLRLAVAWQLRAVDINPANNDATLGAALAAPSPYRLGAFSQALIWDGRDVPLAPHRGTYVTVDVAEGGAFAGGAIDYLRLDVQARTYVQLLPRVILAARARFGVLSAGDAGDPITERFYAGGSDMRGFGFRHLAPQAVDSHGSTFPIGGDALAEASVEARLVAYRWSRDLGVELVLFADVGDVAPRIADLSVAPDRLNWAVGPGAYLLTPIGPIGIDIGLRLNRRDAPNPDAGSWGAFNVTVGEAF